MADAQGTTHDRPATDDRQPEYVYTVRPRCPHCGSVRLRSYKTRDNGDDTLTRYSICQNCGRRLVLVVE
jgi:hypothetical protein